VLSLVAVLTVLVLSFHSTAHQRGVQVHHGAAAAIAAGLADSAVQLAWRSLHGSTGRGGDPLVRILAEADAGELAGVRRPLELGPEADFLREVPGGAHLRVEVEILEAKPLGDPDDPGAGFDPLEKEVLLEVRALARCRGSSWQARERRRVRVQLDLLPIVGKFTLFVRHPEVETEGAPGYNRYANFMDGSPDFLGTRAQDNYLPLTLHHHGDAAPHVYDPIEEGGYVFLGGEAPVKLNLTAGTDEHAGQQFHFQNLHVDPTTPQPALMASNPPPFFQRPHQVAGRTLRFGIKHVIFGYFTSDDGDPRGDMNRGGVLDDYAELGLDMRSSTLHLFGSQAAPSPTRVFGPVYQSYAIFSGVTVDANGDGTRDGLVGLLRAIPDEEFPFLLSRPVPSKVPHLDRPGEMITLDPEVVRYERMFPDYAAYRRVMSTLVRFEPYNLSVDSIRKRGEVPVVSPVLDRARDYPNLGETATLRHRDTSRVHFHGDLNRVGPELLRRRATVRYPDEAAFRRACLRPGGTLELPGTVLVGGDLDLPDNLQVRRGGVLMAEGSVRFDGVTCEEDERLSLVSLGGDVLSPFQFASESTPVQADLVSLDGRVRSTDPTRPWAVRGVVAASRLHPEDFRAGGRILYPVEADPTGPDRGRWSRLVVGDSIESWGS
jgi:hypothetical protein